MPVLFSEPIIMPVKKKKFSMVEQDLPQTTYNMEWVHVLEFVCQSGFISTEKSVREIRKNTFIHSLVSMTGSLRHSKFPVIWGPNSSVTQWVVDPEFLMIYSGINSMSSRSWSLMIYSMINSILGYYGEISHWIYIILNNDHITVHMPMYTFLYYHFKRNPN